MPQIDCITVSPSAAGKTIEAFIVGVLHLGPRSSLKRAFRGGDILVNGRAVTRQHVLVEGDVLEVRSDELFSRADAVVVPNPNLPLEVLCETPAFVAMAKPSGQSIHPLRPDETETTLSALAARYPEATSRFSEAKPLEGGLVHRLDRGTSGVCVCARSAEAWRELKNAWRSREIEKVYLAWVVGSLMLHGRVELELAHDPKNKRRMCVLPTKSPMEEAAFGHRPRQRHVPHADQTKHRAASPAVFSSSGHWPASTSIMPLARSEDSKATLVLLQLHTGVMHQLRVTLAALGHAIVGDEVYTGMRPLKQETLTHPLDDHSSHLLHELAERVLRAQSPHHAVSPMTGALPTHAFFLHAFYLRAPRLSDGDYRGLADGIFASVPEYFGLTGK